MAILGDRHRDHTPHSILAQIDEQTTERLCALASAKDHGYEQRLDDLDKEWDIDRFLEMEFASIALAGLALGSTVHKRYYGLTGLAAGFALIQAVIGWHPMLATHRKHGVRTAREIERERYAIKALRGDFVGVDAGHADDAREGVDESIETRKEADGILES